MRTIDVGRPGWVRIRLDAHALGYGDWHIESPSGDTLHYTVLLPLHGAVEVRTLSIREQSGGWSLVFDLGPTPVAHEAVWIELDRRVVAPACRLEGSSDRRSWSELATGDLFRLGEGEGLDRRELDYRATEARYLRLHWPAEAGFPELRRVVVKVLPEPPGGPVETSLETSRLAAEGRRTEWRLELPAPGRGVVGIRLRGASDGRVGYRAYRAANGRWDLLKEGELDSLDHAILKLPPTDLDWPVLRLELFAEGRGPLRLDRAEAVIRPLWLLFHPPEAGRHRLAYGGQRREAALPGPAPGAAAGEPGQRPRLGPVVERAVPRLQAHLGMPQKSAEGATLLGDWPIESDAARAGDVVRLDLLPVTLAALRDSWDGVRIWADGEQVPFVRWVPPEPALLLEQKGLVPETGANAQESQLSVDLPHPNLPEMEVELVTEAVPFHRRVTLRSPRPARAGVLPRALSRRAEWECPGGGGLPCRHVSGLSGAADGRRIQVVFHDEGQPPLPSVDLRVWGRRSVLLFIWPEAQEVRLVRLYDPSRSPDYELGRHRDLLLREPWVEAHLDPAQLRAGQRGQERRARLILIGSLVVAGAVLVWLLARMVGSAGRRDTA